VILNAPDEKRGHTPAALFLLIHRSFDQTLTHDRTVAIDGCEQVPLGVVPAHECLLGDIPRTFLNSSHKQPFLLFPKAGHGAFHEQPCK
jgi:hypothetical protein